MVDSAFDDEWKLEVEEKVLEYSKQNLKDLDLDKEIEESEIVRCINKLLKNKTGGGDGDYLEGRVCANEMERRTYS